MYELPSSLPPNMMLDLVRQRQADIREEVERARQARSPLSAITSAVARLRAGIALSHAFRPSRGRATR